MKEFMYHSAVSPDPLCVFMFLGSCLNCACLVYVFGAAFWLAGQLQLPEQSAHVLRGEIRCEAFEMDIFNSVCVSLALKWLRHLSGVSLNEMSSLYPSGQKHCGTPLHSSTPTWLLRWDHMINFTEYSFYASSAAVIRDLYNRWWCGCAEV